MNHTNFIREFDKDFVARYHIDHPDVVEQGLYMCKKRAEYIYRVVLLTKDTLGLAEVVEAAHHRVKRLSWHYLMNMDLSDVGFGYCDTIEDFVADVARALDMDREVVRRRCYHAAVFDAGDEDHL